MKARYPDAIRLTTPASAPKPPAPGAGKVQGSLVIAGVKKVSDDDFTVLKGQKLKLSFLGKGGSKILATYFGIEFI